MDLLGDLVMVPFEAEVVRVWVVGVTGVEFAYASHIAATKLLLY